jgi:two-component system, probable response regulator PhcQ
MEQFKILLVDDSPNVLKALQRAFRGEDYGIYTANSAREALEVLKNENIDLLISDENMPEVPGTELLRHVRVQYPHIVRIMLTGMLDLELAKEAINKGEVYKFFNKPWDDFELQISVRYALRQKAIERENAKLKKAINNQQKMFQLLERDYPGITKKVISEDGSFILEGLD